MENNQTHQLVFVDDETNILNSLRRVFLDDEYEIACFESAEPAFQFIQDNEVSLIISDQRMPGEKGDEFLSRVRQLKPETIRIMLTGYSDIDSAVNAINKGQVYKFISKPWSDEELRTTVLRSLEYYELQRTNENLMSELMIKNAEMESLNQMLFEKVKKRTKLLIQKNLELERTIFDLQNRHQKAVRFMGVLFDSLEPERFQQAVLSQKVGMKIMAHIQITQQQKDRLFVAIALAQIERMAHGDRGEIVDHARISQFLMWTVREWFQLEDIANILASIFENWDGKGAPSGMKGAEIPFESRFIRLVHDLVEQIVSTDDNDEKLWEFLRSGQDTLFDPELCEAAMKGCDFGGFRILAEKRDCSLEHLRVGQELAEPLRTSDGQILLWAHTVLKDEHIEWLRKYNEELPDKISIAGK